MHPKNILFGTSGGISQVALFDFDLAYFSNPDYALGETQMTKGFENQFNQALETIGGVVARLVRCASVGYFECASSTTGAAEINRSSSFPMHIACPFESMLRRMLPQPGVLTRRDLGSLQSLSSRRIKRTMTCAKNGKIKFETEGLAEVACLRLRNPHLISERNPCGYPNESIIKACANCSTSEADGASSSYT